MNFRNQLLGVGSLLLILFSSCKKDLVSSQASQEAVVASNLTAADTVIETASPLTTPITTDVNPNCAGYFEILPARYQITTKKYPLILFIHGIGELGTGVSRLTCCGIPYWANKKLFPADFVVNGQHFSYVVMAPQFKVRPSPADMQNCIDYAVKKYRIDPTRIYISGLSMGGGSTWDYSAVYGQNVAAAVPVCGGSAPTQSLAASIASKNLPIWTISSTADSRVPISWATDWVAWIKADNLSNAANVNITTYTSGESHNNTWFKAFNPQTKVNGMNVYEWMLRYTRGGSQAPPPANQPPVANAGSNTTIHLSWNFNPLLNGSLSKDPDGWVKSTVWSKVSGPNSYAFANSGAVTRVLNLVQGVYVFRCTVTDNLGATGTADVTITVLP